MLIAFYALIGISNICSCSRSSSKTRAVNLCCKPPVQACPPWVVSTGTGYLASAPQGGILYLTECFMIQLSDVLVIVAILIVCRNCERWGVGGANCQLVIYPDGLLRFPEQGSPHHFLIMLRKAPEIWNASIISYGFQLSSKIFTMISTIDPPTGPL